MKSRLFIWEQSYFNCFNCYKQLVGDIFTIKMRLALWWIPFIQIVFVPLLCLNHREKISSSTQRHRCSLGFRLFKHFIYLFISSPPQICDAVSRPLQVFFISKKGLGRGIIFINKYVLYYILIFSQIVVINIWLVASERGNGPERCICAFSFILFLFFY